MSSKHKWKPGSIRHDIFLKQGRKCCYCECEMIITSPKTGTMTNPAMATLEHLNRRADGGDNNKDNLAIACWECNHGRGRVDWLTYKSWVMDNVTKVEINVA